MGMRDKQMKYKKEKKVIPNRIDMFRIGRAARRMAKATMIAGMAMFLGACSGQHTPDMEAGRDGGYRSQECGGTEDRSDVNASKVIASDELASFSATFEKREVYIGGADAAEGWVYPNGRYRFEMKKDEDEGGVSVTADFAGEVYTFTAGPETPGRLNRLLKDNDVAAMNGHSKWNSALDTYISLSAVYADGETISIYAEGGASTIPDGWNCIIYIRFFDGLMEECTGQSVWETYITDNSDPDAPKEFTSQELRYIYANFYYRYGLTKAEGEKRPGRYLLHMDFDHLRYAGIDENCTIWRDSELLGRFDADEKDAVIIQEWISSHDLISMNGMEKTCEIDSYQSLELTVCYADESELSIHVYGTAVIPRQWDSDSFMELIDQIAKRHGVGF